MECSKAKLSKVQAASSLNALHRSGKWTHKTPGRIYQCPHCNYWHLTHIEEFDGKGAARNVKIVHEEKFKQFLTK